jgi:D-alanyl-D-alanine carboxypeptidase (penicillin-binding protein 5/6)
MDQNSKSVLFAKSATDSLYPASTTKIMTALVALSTFPLDKVITVTRSYPDGQNIHLSPSEQLTVDQLLHALLIQSANDAAEVLAENYPGGRAAFVDAMNVKATQLHLANTHFLNPTGLDEEGHFSTALDLVRLSDFALKNPHFARLVSIENSVVSTSVSPHLLTNVNQLLGKIPGVIGVKTGQTDKAGQSLITLVNRANHPVLLSVMGSKDRFADTTLLIDWVYTNFYWVDPDSLDQLH